MLHRPFVLAMTVLPVAVTLAAQPRRPAAAPGPASDSQAVRRLAAERKADPAPAPARREGEGPFQRLIIRGVNLIDGYGSAPRGPVDVVVEGNRIAEIVSIGYPKLPIDQAKRPKGATKELDAEGMYLMPGLIDLHVHQGTQQKAPESEYYNKLWLAHGITTVRGVPFASFDYSVKERARSATNEIAAPRYVVYQRPGTGWGREKPRTPDEAREWVRWAKANGADGLKLGAERPDLMEALLDEARKLGLGSTAHLQQAGVAQVNADVATRMGLEAVTHFYGLFESMYDNHQVQPWPLDANLQDEQVRFGQVARQWSLVTPRGEKWNALLKKFLERDVTLDPTMTTYLTGRDVMKRIRAPWHDRYTIPSQWDFYVSNRENHGAYFYDWTTEDEVAWRNFYRVWMMFLNDYKNMGGRVTASSDAGFIYNTPGFSTIEELELLQEAGFYPGEAIRAGTYHAAIALNKATRQPIDRGVVEPGMLADLVIVPDNPFRNLKVLYGTGWFRLDDATGKVEPYGGVRWTIKDGIVYDARQLLRDIATMGDAQRKARAVGGK
ncbi:MAG: amidohydrolase [Gemmatimonadota bacterium]|jgi:imidazolonepropionase-like amidohydrolase|nr:amidohydrolase family protein [Gemmatimonadota bacterium]